MKKTVYIVLIMWDMGVQLALEFEEHNLECKFWRGRLYTAKHTIRKTC